MNYCRRCAADIPEGRVMCSSCLDSYTKMAEGIRLDNARKDRKIILLVLLTMGFMVACYKGCGASVVTEAFVDWVAVKESGWNRYAHGRNGELGKWQLKAIAVRDVNNNFRSSYKFADVMDDSKGRQIAKMYLQLCERRLANRLGSTPDQTLVYSAYRMGYAGLMRSGRAGVLATSIVARKLPLSTQGKTLLAKEKLQQR